MYETSLLPLSEAWKLLVVRGINRLSDALCTHSPPLTLTRDLGQSVYLLASYNAPTADLFSKLYDISGVPPPTLRCARVHGRSGAWILITLDPEDE